MLKWLCIFCIFLGSCSLKTEKHLPLTSKAQKMPSQPQLLQQLLGGPYQADDQAADYVKKVGEKLARVSDHPHLPYEFILVNSSQVNASILPRGKILVHRGLLTQLRNEAELAAVLSHQIAHTAASSPDKSWLLNTVNRGLKESVQLENTSPLFSIPQNFLHRQYSRHQEFQADKSAMKYMALAGYNTQAAINLQKTFLDLSQSKSPHWLEGLFASHPPSKMRLEKSLMHQSLYAKHEFLGHIDYQKHLKTLFDSRFAYELFDKAKTTEDIARAKKWLDEAIELQPKEAHFHGLLAKIYLEEKQLPKALSSIKKALKLNPHYYEFHLTAGTILYENKQSSQAIKQLHISNRYLNHPKAHYYLALLYEGKKNLDKAQYHYQQASQAPSDYGKHASLRHSQLHLKQHPEKYLVIHPILTPDSELFYRVRSKSTLPIQQVKVSVFAANQLLETFYIQDLKGMDILEVPATLPLSKKRLKNLRLDFSFQTM